MRSTRGIWSSLLLSLVGIGIACYLFYLHLGLLRGELLGDLACGGSGVFNCHAVTASPWGSALGLPLPLWGLIGYLATLTLSAVSLLFPEWRSNALTLLFTLGVLFLVVDGVLLGIMVIQIRLLCPLCLVTYLVNAWLVISAKAALGQRWRALFRQIPATVQSFALSPQQAIPWIVVGVTALGLFGAVGLHAAVEFVSQSNPALMRKQIRDFVMQQPRASVEVAGAPTLGPATGSLQVIEFSDFLCPVCQRASRFNTILLASHRRDVQFIFKTFPLDTTCNAAISRMLHPGACAVASAAQCAHLQGKFWPFHDRIFEEGHSYPVARLRSDAAQVGLDVGRFEACMTSGEGMEAVQRDIAEAQKLGITSTPTYFINGYRLSGLMTPFLFEELSAVLHEGKR